MRCCENYYEMLDNYNYKVSKESQRTDKRPCIKAKIMCNYKEFG